MFADDCCCIHLAEAWTGLLDWLLRPDRCDARGEVCSRLWVQSNERIAWICMSLCTHMSWHVSMYSSHAARTSIRGRTILYQLQCMPFCKMPWRCEVIATHKKQGVYDCERNNDAEQNWQRSQWPECQMSNWAAELRCACWVRKQWVDLRPCVSYKFHCLLFIIISIIIAVSCTLQREGDAHLGQIQKRCLRATSACTTEFSVIMQHHHQNVGQLTLFLLTEAANRLMLLSLKTSPLFMGNQHHHLLSY